MERLVGGNSRFIPSTRPVCVSVWVCIWVSVCLFLSTNLLYHRTAEAQWNPSAHVHAMAPLWVEDWNGFYQQLLAAKTLGVTAISVDIWWGKVQEDGPDRFDWIYYDRIFKMITDAGLNVVPILSTHQCGGNVGDNVNIPIPSWFLEKLRRLHTPQGQRDGRYLSEAGNWSDEVASVWATLYVIEDYQRFYEAFQQHFQGYAQSGKIASIFVGMGPAGELSLPSYHQHDRNNGFDKAHVPGRGSLQASSALAQDSLRTWLKGKYQTIEHLNQSWGTSYQNFSELTVLTKTPEVDALFNGQVQSQKGKDFFEWYNGSLLQHGRLLGKLATKVFHSVGSAYLKSPLAIKIPGLHWHFHTRYPLLTAGQISTADWAKEKGFGYLRTFREFFQELRTTHPHSQWTGAFTAAEMGGNPHHAPFFSGAFELADGIGHLADQFGIAFTLENALASNLYSQESFNILTQHLRNHPQFKGVTLLRLHDVLHSDPAKHFVRSVTTTGRNSCRSELKMIHRSKG